jgi:putative FmdB family regulatory protein
MRSARRVREPPRACSRPPEIGCVLISSWPPDNCAVPLYDFHCRDCEDRFEAHVPYGERPRCPACGSKDTERVPTSFAGPFKVGLRGGEARRSNSARCAREERRRERRERRKTEER